jgi:hypothetical protein
VRPELVDALLALAAHDVLPRIPERGSVGASGDLAPLAHLALALIGEGEADHDGRVLRGPDVMRAAGLEPIELQAKEGLALLNGTQLSTALAIEGWLRAKRLLEWSMRAGAMSVEALAGSHKPFDARIHAARRLEGQQRVAERMRALLDGSAINESHADCDRVQDPYALRCMPQVFGAAWDTLEHAASVLELEANGVSDNPLIFGDEVLSGGNFHAEPIAFASDFMAIALTELGLAWSHEEAIMEMMQHFVSSYKDLPISVYQFQTKLRNELRAKSGIMRGREFVMKDMYSLHATQEDMDQYYDSVIEAYNRIYERLGIGDSTFVTFASGGAFTKFSHEFQTICEAGEDVLYTNEDHSVAVNEEVLDDATAELGVNKSELKPVTSAEVGNIFKFGTEKSEKMGIYYTDEDGKQQPIYLASYGVGVTRVMGVLVERFLRLAGKSTDTQ